MIVLLWIALGWAAASTLLVVATARIKRSRPAILRLEEELDADPTLAELARRLRDVA